VFETVQAAVHISGTYMKYMLYTFEHRISFVSDFSNWYTATSAY